MLTEGVVLLVILSLFPVLGIVTWGDPCYITPDRIPQKGEVVTIEFTRECSKGAIRWDDPRGTLQVHFTPPNKAPFRLCLQPGMVNVIDEIYSVVEEKKTPVRKPTEGNDSCISSHQGQVLLQLKAPPVLMVYLTTLNFSVSLI